jgi:hypothetical protein
MGATRLAAQPVTRGAVLCRDGGARAGNPRITAQDLLTTAHLDSKSELPRGHGRNWTYFSDGNGSVLRIALSTNGTKIAADRLKDAIFYGGWRCPESLVPRNDCATETRMGRAELVRGANRAVRFSGRYAAPD